MGNRARTIDNLLMRVAPERRRQLVVQLFEHGASHVARDEPERMLMRLLAEEIAAEPGQRSLDKAFGFRERGGTSPAYASRLARRNALLVGLWRSQPQWADLSAVEASEAMDRAARAYRARRWNSDRKRSTPPASEPAATFWRVMVDGGKIPQAETIRDIFLGVST